jgi:hypothetical protein
MKRRFFALSGALFVICFMLPACQKDYNEPNLTATVQNNLTGGGGNKIRLGSVSSDFGMETFQYNDEGLLYRWDLLFGYTIKRSMGRSLLVIFALINSSKNKP